ncbi:MAG TPA: NifU family protein [Acidimicrobiales bacterium]|nr:NifU family protein [Acidimicrobiales bacterium]
MDPILKVTEAARAMVLDIRASEAEADLLALWLEVSGVVGTAFSYDMWFQLRSDAGADDVVQEQDGLSLVIPAESADRLRGATLDAGADGDGGLVIINPNVPERRPSSPTIEGRPPAELSGPIAERVIAVLDEQVNPSISMHGGHAELVAIEEGVAYLRLSGGCQGCGLAKVTLSQGIAVAIQDSVPEITEVVDVTDHAHGDNPFYEPSKK